MQSEAIGLATDLAQQSEHITKMELNTNELVTKMAALKKAVEDANIATEQKNHGDVVIDA